VLRLEVGADDTALHLMYRAQLWTKSLLHFVQPMADLYILYMYAVVITDPLA
jgi:hypothetical protein